MWYGNLYYTLASNVFQFAATSPWDTTYFQVPFKKHFLKSNDMKMKALHQDSSTVAEEGEG